MKKIISAILTLILIIACTACGNEPIDYYTDAIRKFGKASGVQIDFTNSLSFNGTSGNFADIYTGTVKLMHDRGTVSALELNGVSDVDPGLESTIKVPLEAYYHEGALYQKMSGSSYFLPVSWEQAHELIGLVAGPVEVPAETDFKALAIEEANGNTQLNFIVTAESAAAIAGLTNQWESYASLKENGSYCISDIFGSLILDSSRRPLSEKLTVTGTVQFPDETVSVSSEISLVFSYPEELNVNAPAGADYKSVQ